MAKNTYPTMKSSSGVFPKLVVWAITVLIVVLAIQHPPEAGQLLTTILTALHNVAAH
jgi:hypothetical protein